jgi:hypothetical protein
LATTSPDLREKVEELYEIAKQAHKDRITKEMPWIVKTLEESEQEEKGEV